MKVTKVSKEVEKVVIETVEEINITLSKQEAMTLCAIMGGLSPANAQEQVQSSVNCYPAMKRIVPSYSMDIKDLIISPLFDHLLKELNIKVG